MALTVSIIVPTHDRHDALFEAVEAIVQQSRPADELIVVSDGDLPLPDELARRCDQANLPLTIIQRNTPSLTASRNAGIDAATGEIILMLEDDAVIPPDYLQRVMAYFAADCDRAIAAIGSTIRQPGDEDWKGRLWMWMERTLGHAQWTPRCRISRYQHVSLPQLLRRELQSAGRLYGAGTAIRRSWAKQVRYTEDFTGYAYGEDREFSFRLGRVAAVYHAPSLVVDHHPRGGGRGSLYQRGRDYVRNSLYIARHAAESGVGTVLVVAMDFAGTLGQYLLWSLWGNGRRSRLSYAVGMVAELTNQLTQMMRRWL